MPGRTPSRSIDSKQYALLLARLVPQPPRSDKEHDAMVTELMALDEIEDPTPEQRAAAELLTALLEHYENRTVVMSDSSPHEALLALIEDRSLRHKDIAEIVGNKGLTTEILAGRREISKATARKLASGLKVPIELFI